VAGDLIRWIGSALMAVSAETVALIAAGGTAVGALIGSTTGGLVDFWLDRARERRRAKVGARMVRADLALAASRLKAMEDE
jgi:membrane protein YqaA with SNARE-associated domain